jgi:transcriptional regulator with XRE-family HTH domain
MVRNVATQRSIANSTLFSVATGMDPAEIGRRIKSARHARLWTQAQFATAASVSLSTIARWESGKLPSVRELVRVADLLDLIAVAKALGVEVSDELQPARGGEQAV